MRIVDANDPARRLRSVEAIDDDNAADIGQWQNSVIRFYGGNPQPLLQARGTAVRVINEDGDFETVELSTDEAQLLEAEPDFREAWLDGELSG